LGARYLASSALITLVGQIVRLTGTFALLLFLARQMAIEEYASVVVLVALVGIAAVVSRLGLPRAAIRFIAEDRHAHGDAAAAQTTRRILAFGAGIAAAQFPLWAWGILPALLTSVLHDDALAARAPVIAGCIVIEGLQLTAAEMCRAHHRQFAAVSFGYAGRATLLFVGSVVLALAGVLDVERFTELYLVSTGIVTCVTAAYLLRLTHRMAVGNGPIDRRPVRFRAVLGIGVPLSVNDVASLMLMQADTLVVAAVATADDVAFYNAAARVANLVTLPYLALSVALPPVVAALWARREQKRLESTLGTASFVGSVPTVLVAAAVAAVPALVLGVLFGSSFEEGRWVLVILLVGPIANAASGFASQVLVMSGHHRSVMVISASVTLVVIAAEVLLGRVWGVLGVAAASGLGTVLLNTTMMGWTYRETHIGTWAGPPSKEAVDELLRGLPGRRGGSAR
jgi:PST family polysaccharide transporter